MPLTYFITGCSTGFGRELCEQVLARGDRVIATARKLEAIKDLEAKGAKILTLDVTADLPTIQALVDRAIGFYGSIDILINNAGYTLTATVEDSEGEERKLFETNLWGSLKVTRAVLHHMRPRKSGKILMVASNAGWLSKPAFATYSASKFAMEAYSESLRDELSPLGIQVLVTEPGYFRTDILASQNRKVVVPASDDYEELFRTRNEFQNKLDGNERGNPEIGMSILLDALTKTGVFKDRPVPFRIPLGQDAYDFIQQKCEEGLNTLRDYKDIILSTDFPTFVSS